jgi:hypothetical protein
MIKTAMRAFMLACSLPLILSANFLINDYIVSPKAGKLIETMGNELTQKTGINAYVVTTTDKIEHTTNLYEYIKRYESKLNKPYAVLFFAPNSHRIGVLGSSDEIKKMYKPDEIKYYAVEILSSEDSNSAQSKYDLGIVQAYSELADELASAKDVKLTTTIENKTGWIITLIRWIVILGALIVLWVYFGHPFYKRIINGKQ